MSTGEGVESQSDDARIARIARWAGLVCRRYGAWVAYVAVAIACTKYLNDRTQLVPKKGEWYMASEGYPYVLLQVRAILSGRLAIFPHSNIAGSDSLWGRGGMHTNWGLGVPILALPFYVLGRLFRAPGFPDDVFFLVLYALTTAVLAGALHRVRAREPNALVAACAASGFVMVFPTFVGLVASRFLIYEQTIAVGALWSVLLLAGVLWLVQRATPGRLAVVCAAAGFSTMIRIPLAIYGMTTVAVSLLVAHRQGVRPRALLSGLLAYAAVTTLYLTGNALRFGYAFVTGYENCMAGAFPNRGTRWGTPFLHVPIKVAAKEMFATLFRLEPVPYQIMMGAPPESVRPYVVGERWREYYSPTYNMVIFWLWAAAAVIVVWRITARRLWRRDRDLAAEVATVVGAWALAPSLVLFVFYARVVSVITRYATDIYPAVAAACLCVGIAVVDVLRKHAPSRTGSAQIAIAGVVALDISGWRGWPTQLSRPVDRKTIEAIIAGIDSHADDKLIASDHFKCREPRPPPPVHSQFAEWWPDCSFSSGMVFAMRHSPCLTFTFGPSGRNWDATDDEMLAGIRATGDFDRLVRCGPAVADGAKRSLTMCEPRRPAFLVDDMRLYSVASLDADLTPTDGLKLLAIDTAPACPP